MKAAILQKCLLFVMIAGLIVVLVPASQINASGVTLSITIDGLQSAGKPQGGSFVARINLSGVTSFAGHDISVSYDPSVVQVVTPFPGSVPGTLWVTPGLIESTVIPLEWAIFVPSGVQGVSRIVGLLHQYPMPTSVSGSGYLFDLHFQVVGTPGQSSNLTFTDVDLRTNLAQVIPVDTLVNGSVQVISAPVVTDVDTDKADGIYTAGEIIDIAITYSDVVIVNTAGGTPALGLNSGGNAAYLSGSGSNTLTFRYTVGAGQNTSDLDYSSTGSLVLSGGTIRDGAAHDADNTLPAVGTFASAHALVIDTIAPFVTAVDTSRADGSYAAGENIDIAVDYSENVIVNTAGGTPALGLNSGGNAAYMSGSGSSTLIFRNTVGAGQNTGDLDYSTTGSLVLNGGSIRDAASNNAGNTLPPVGSFAAAHAIVIDTTPPSVALTSPAASSTNLSPVAVTAAFSENVAGFTIGDIVVGNGTAGDFAGGPAIYTFNILPASQGQVTVDISAGAAHDIAGNNSTAAAQLSRTYDSVAPAVTAVTTAKANGTYTTGAVIDITLAYNENVNVNTAGGTPSLGLNSGGSAIYNSGSGTGILTFRYTVGAGQNSGDLDYTSTGSLVLNGGTIRDAALNDADNTLPAVGTLAAAHDIVISSALPLITALVPAAGAQITTLNVVITGSNLSGTTSISFGAGITVNSFTINSESEITANISIAVDAAIGARDVTVTAAAGSNTLDDGFTVILRGDADGDGYIGIGDVITVELIMLGALDPTPGADANGDGKVNIADVITIELIMAGIIS